MTDAAASDTNNNASEEKQKLPVSVSFTQMIPGRESEPN